MTIAALSPGILAVHISDSVLSPAWASGGFVVAAGLALFGSWRIRDEEIAPVALLTAAFFVASQVHVRVGPTSAHLLLNGLLGVVLGTRACLAIPVGLLLQAVLTGHGGFSALGVNSCVMAIPALFAAGLFAMFRRAAWLRRPTPRLCLTIASLMTWGWGLVWGIALFVADRHSAGGALDWRLAWRLACQAHGLAAVCAFAAVGAYLERQLESAPEFPLGLLIGTTTVFLTLVLNGVALVWGGTEDWRSFAVLMFVAHLPVALIESLVLGFAVGFLARVKPDLIGWHPAEEIECPADALT